MKTYEGGAVAILGAGPAGLLAAFAAELAGYAPMIFAAPDERRGYGCQKSRLSGATYLHEAIPNLTSIEPDDSVRFVKIGTKSGYALKVYGSNYADCSWDKFDEGEHPCWALQPVYDDLWARFHHITVPQQIGPVEAQDIVDSFPLVISTISATALCCEGHDFPRREIWITDDAIPEVTSDPCILYDGRIGTPGQRYRSARIFGHDSTEYMQEVAGSRAGIKPMATNCDCFPTILRAGRWGEWKPGILVNHAFAKVSQRLSPELRDL